MREATRSSRRSIRLGLAGALALAAGPGCSLVFGLDDLQSGATGDGGAGTTTSSSVTAASSSGSATGSTASATTSVASTSASSSSGGPSDPYRDAVLADGPVLYLRLAETSGITLFDEVTQASVGAYAGSGITLAVPGIPGATSSAASFSGGQALAADSAATDFVGLASYTLEAWINPEVDAMTMDYYGRVLAKEQYNGGTNRQGYNILYERSNFHPQGGLITERWNVGGVGADVAPFKQNEGSFHHAVTTFDGATLRLYVDGLAVAQNTSATPLLDLAVPLAIGSLPDTGSPFFGVIDEVAIYDHALTPTEIGAHFTVGSTP